MKSIHQLIPDIYRLVGRKDGWFTPELSANLASEITRRLSDHYGKTRPPHLSLSQMGPRCPRSLWASVHASEEAEPLPAPAVIKYAYGHILEAKVIALARAAGYEVTGEQDELTVLGVKGHRDCVINGVLVDVKSASSPSFKKFQDRSIQVSDTFGYLDQLDGYLVGSAEDDLVRVKDKAYDLVIDKTLGKLTLYEHHLRRDHILERVEYYKGIVALSEPPPCTCKEIKDGESGNLILDVAGSYNAFKYYCKPYLRTFIFSGGPRYFTRVSRRPEAKIIEVDRHGRRIF